MLARTLHTVNDGNVMVVAALDDAGRVCIGETRNEEHAAEGRIDTLRVVMSLADAVTFAKAVLAATEEAEQDAWIDAMYQRVLDHQALVSDCLEANYNYEFVRCEA